MDHTIILSILILGCTAAISTIVLYFVSRRFSVAEDPKISEVETLLPQANCGGCGHAGCHDFAVSCAAADESGFITNRGRLQPRFSDGSLNGICAYFLPRSTFRFFVQRTAEHCRPLADRDPLVRRESAGCRNSQDASIGKVRNGFRIDRFLRYVRKVQGKSKSRYRQHHRQHQQNR